MDSPERNTLDSKVMGGKPCIRGMRVAVGLVAGLVCAGRTTAEIPDACPWLEGEDVRQALAYARGTNRRRRKPPPAA